MTESSPSSHTESPSCAWCGCSQTQQLYRLGHLGIAACVECGLCFASPRETEEKAKARYQREEYFRTDKLKCFGYDDYAAHREIHERVFDQALRNLEQIRPEKGRILDVGCALGFLLHAAAKRGWRPEGVDLSPWASQEARRLTGQPVHTGDIGELPLESEHYDALTLFDVIEHVYDPRETFTACNRLLKPGGHVYIITPNHGGYQRRIMGRRWFHYKPLEHTFYFDRTTLRRFMEEAGLEPIQLRRNLRWVTPRFLTERLRYYNRSLAWVLYNLFGRWRWSEKLKLPLFTGEIEVIGRKSAGRESGSATP